MRAYLIPNEQGLTIRAGYDHSLESYMVTVDETGYRWEWERADEAVNDLSRICGERVSSGWLWRLVEDSYSPRLPRPATRGHEAPGGITSAAPDHAPWCTGRCTCWDNPPEAAAA